MSRSRWLVLVSSFAVALTVLARPSRAEQPVLPPPPAPTAQPAQPAPEAGPAAPTQTPALAVPPAEQPRPQQGPPTTSEYPPLPPVPSEPAAAPAMPRGTAPPGATPVMPAAPPASRQFNRYPVTVMVADALWIVAAAQAPESPVLYLGGYTFAAPVAHLVMGNPRSALISGGLRAGAVAFTMAATIRALDCYGDCDADIGLVAVGLIGAATIMVVDWAVLAKKEVPLPVQPRSAPDWAVTPQMQVGQGGVQLGLGGWF
jgi:hypothetical protein